MLSQPQYDRIAALTDEQARRLLRHHLKLIIPEDDPAVPRLLSLTQSAKYDQRRLLLPLFRTTDPVEIATIETVVGRPITHIRRITAHVGPVRPGRPKPPPREDNRTITSIVPNPKKYGSASYQRYEAYREGMTVSEAKAAGITSGDLKWDTEKGFICIS